MNQNDESSKTPTLNRRKHARAPIELCIEYERLNAFFADYTKNISKGGTFIRTTQPLETGTRFVFSLKIPEREEDIKLSGEVVRIVTEDMAKENEKLEPGMGIRFLYETKKEKERIETIAGDLMKKSLGEKAYRELMKQ